MGKDSQWNFFVTFPYQFSLLYSAGGDIHRDIVESTWSKKNCLDKLIFVLSVCSTSHGRWETSGWAVVFLLIEQNPRMVEWASCRSASPAETSSPFHPWDLLQNHWCWFSFLLHQENDWSILWYFPTSLWMFLLEIKYFSLIHLFSLLCNRGLSFT